MTSLVTSHKVKKENKVGLHDSHAAQQYFICLRFVLRSILFTLQKQQFQHSHIGLYYGRGHVTDLNSDDLHEKSEICKMSVPGTGLVTL